MKIDFAYLKNQANLGMNNRTNPGLFYSKMTVSNGFGVVILVQFQKSPKMRRNLICKLHRFGRLISRIVFQLMLLIKNSS